MSDKLTGSIRELGKQYNSDKLYLCKDSISGDITFPINFPHEKDLLKKYFVLHIAFYKYLFH